MMTLQDILKAQGLTEDQVTAIEASMKENKIFTAGGENLDIRYGKLKGDHDTLKTQYAEAQALIEQMKAQETDTAGAAEKLATAEATIQQLTAQIEADKLNNAVRFALMQAGAGDVDYLTFKLFNGDDKPVIDESGKLVAWDDKLKALKTQHPSMFQKEAAGHVLENRLPNEPAGGDTVTKEAFSKMGYLQRAQLAKDNPEQYAQLTSGK